ncbi:MAG: hypothetical protein RI930_379 [Pseudomonadota bacterium]
MNSLNYQIKKHTLIEEIAKLFYSKTLSTEEILQKYSITQSTLYKYCCQYKKIHGESLKLIKKTLTNRQFEIAKLFYSWQFSNDEILQKYSITLTQLRFYCLQYRKIYGEQFKPKKEKKIPKKEKKLIVDFETQQKIIELYKKRIAPSKMIKIFNLSAEKIEYVINRYRKTLSKEEADKLNLRTLPLTKKEQEQIIYLYFNEIKSIQCIAKQINKKPKQIYNAIRRYQEKNMPLYLSNQERIAELKEEEERNLTNDALIKLTKEQIIDLCKRNKNMIPRVAMAKRINVYKLLSWLK